MEKQQTSIPLCSLFFRGITSQVYYFHCLRQIQLFSLDRRLFQQTILDQRSLVQVLFKELLCQGVFAASFLLCLNQEVWMRNKGEPSG